MTAAPSQAAHQIPWKEPLLYTRMNNGSVTLIPNPFVGFAERMSSAQSSENWCSAAVCNEAKTIDEQACDYQTNLPVTMP